MWGLAAALLLLAGAVLALFASEPWRGASVALEPLARAPKMLSPPGGSTTRGELESMKVNEDAWRVEAFVGEEMCNQPEVEAAVEAGSSLPEGVPLDTGMGSTARLRRGEASAELHPGSQVQQAGGVLELNFGRLWAELPARADGAPWRLSTRDATLQTKQARFVWWAFDGALGEDGAPFRIGDEVGVEIVSGELTLTAGGARITAGAGQTCRASLLAEGGVKLAPFGCAPTR
jgi:hypothetical protein